MTSTDASPRNAAKGAGFGARYALMLIALLWSAQLLSVVGLLAGNAQAQVAIHFHTTQVAWFMLATNLVGTFIAPFVVKFASMYGKKRVMVIITVLGLIGDLIAALAPNYTLLLIGRGMAGFYAAIAALVYAIARDVFPPRLVGPASGLISGGIGLVALGGPFLSGWLIDNHGFRGVLWFLTAATALSLVLLLVFVPESPVREERTRIDWLGGLLLGGGLASITYGIGKGAEWGWTSGTTFAFIGGGIVAVVAFVVVERVIAHPLFDLSMLARRQVWTVFLATALIAGTVYSAGTINQLLGLLPKIPTISDGLGFSATKAAWIGAPASVLLVATALAAGVLARRVDARLLLGTGAALALLGYVLQSQFHHTASQLLAVGIVPAVGIGLIVAVVPILVIEAVSPQEQVLANGMQGMMQGIVLTMLTQLIFVTMAQDGKVLKGTQFYLDAGFTNGFWLAAGFAGAGLLAVLLIPKGKSLEETEVGQAAV
ncbi:MFS transporter [Actinomadura rudentiformis]|uniref:MFS transporter n=1 Tax=Actinomadura rudentiformis TaxID=359158 RepID=A0A6H9YDD6_9ACTN|nr:MFS transporter [Actinomadura rudentiformis]KAB2341607.1 MFS transporter [Actinomadura rudentiformis]